MTMVAPGSKANLIKATNAGAVARVGIEKLVVNLFLVIYKEVVNLMTRLL
jgi:hypothetical protein